VILLSNLQLRAVLATDARGEYAFGEYLALRLATAACAFGLIVPIAFAAGRDARGVLWILILGLAKTFEALSDVFYGLFQRREDMARIARSLLLRSTSLVTFTGVLLLGGQVVWAAGTLAAVWLAVLLLHDLPAARRLSRDSPSDAVAPSWNRERLGALARRSLPLGLVMLLISLNTNVPRYFIAHHLGEESLGIFAAIASLVLAGNLIVDALGQAASPRLARMYAAGSIAAFRSALWRLLGIGAAVGAAGLAVAILAGGPILDLVFGRPYAAHASLLVWLMLAGAVGYLASLLGFGMTAARRFGVQLPIFAVVTASLTVSCAWLVPRHGLAGAAWATLLSSALSFAGAALVVGRAAGSGGR